LDLRTIFSAIEMRSHVMVKPLRLLTAFGVLLFLLLSQGNQSVIADGETPNSVEMEFEFGADDGGTAWQNSLHGFARNGRNPVEPRRVSSIESGSLTVALPLLCVYLI
jgi:hypothetical protein